MKFHIETYGCQMNIADSELMTGVLLKEGYQPTNELEDADLVLLNTCAIREHAEQRVLGRVSSLNSLKYRNREVLIGVTGCMAQRMGSDLLKKAPYIDLIIGPDGYRHLPQLIANARTSHQQQAWLELNAAENYRDIWPAREQGPSAWVTIMRGCNKKCTFCIVPYVRGGEKNRPYSEIIADVEKLVNDGVKEITLLGQTVNAYRYEDMDFAQLLRRLNTISGLERIRFTSPHPAEMSDAAMLAMAECDKVCEHLHFPVQSGSNRMLKRMVRIYKIEQYRAQVQRLRELMPGIGLTTDIIVGFPGESDADYQLTYELMEEIDFHTSFLFKFSYRDGTPAMKMTGDDVPEEVKQERLEKLINLQRRQTHERSQREVGQVFEILVEGDAKRDGQSRGRTRQNQMVVFPQGTERPGDIVHVKIKEGSGWTLIGEIV